MQLRGRSKKTVCKMKRYIKEAYIRYTTCPYDGLYSTRKDVIFSKKESLIDEGGNEDEVNCDNWLNFLLT